MSFRFAYLLLVPLIFSSAVEAQGLPCCSPPYVRKIITARCTFPSLGLVRNLVREKVKEHLVNQGCTRVRTSVRVSRAVTAREDVGLKNLVNVSTANNDALTFRVDSVNTTCSLPVIIQVTSRFRDRFSIPAQRTFQSEVSVTGDYR